MTQNEKLVMALKRLDAHGSSAAVDRDPLPVTVVVPVKNEERNLARCLAALSRFSKILVIDSHSDDRTVPIAEAAGVEVLQFDWNGKYPKKRNWVLSTYRVKTEWVLFLDADELVDKEFCDALARALPVGGFDAYWLNYTNYFMGRKLRFGLPQRKLALIRVGAGLFERIEEDHWSDLDMEIHEHPIIEGPIGEILSRIDHNDFRGLSKFLERHLSYANWEARRYLVLSQANEKPSCTRRQRVKYKNLEAWWYPLTYFFFSYFVRLGFLDGGPGFYYAFYKAWYFNTIRLLIKEQRP